MQLPRVFAVEGVPRPYAWGSRSAIQNMIAIEPDGRPLAELWFGAHADDPSPVRAHQVDLATSIAANPAGLLSAEIAERFDGRLPFLLKILAAETALSIQVHPSRAQAAAGFADENARGIAPGAAERNYRDANHKPELLCALTPFEALCGFRPVEDTLAVLDAIGVPELGEMRRSLAGPDGVRSAFTDLLTLDDPAPVVSAVVARAHGEHCDGAVGDALHVVRLLANDFPGDVGIVLSLLLNYVLLSPGEAIYLSAGNVHCYLRGTGVEIMANSDNVLRCALTPKHVDVAEVLRIADFTPLSEPRCPVETSDFGADYRTPVPDFHLESIDLDAYKGSCAIGMPGPHLVLCVEGSVSVSAGSDDVEIGPGQAAFVAAYDVSDPATKEFRVRGSGRLFWASVRQPAG